MKKILTIFSELFGVTTPNILKAATLDFCFDHVVEDRTCRAKNQMSMPKQSFKTIV